MVVGRTVFGLLVGAPLVVLACFIAAGLVIAFLPRAPQAIALPIICSPVLAAFATGVASVRNRPGRAFSWLAAAVGGALLLVWLSGVLQHVEI